jgi:hypothetical protein
MMLVRTVPNERVCKLCGCMAQGGLSVTSARSPAVLHGRSYAGVASIVKTGYLSWRITGLQQYTPRDLFGPTQCATGDGRHWTVPDLRQAVERWTGVVYQDAQSYRNLFAHCGFSYQRTERQYRSRKEADVAAFSEQVEKN